MKLNNVVINPEFETLFHFKNEEEKIEHDAQMISYRILSEIEKYCDEKKIKKKDLALLTGTSKSYITQLFNGTKLINANILAKFENILNVTIEVKLKSLSESYEEFWKKQITNFNFGITHYSAKKGAWYYSKAHSPSENIVSKLKTENTLKQVA